MLNATSFENTAVNINVINAVAAFQDEEIAETMIDDVADETPDKVYTWGNLSDTALLAIIKGGTTKWTRAWFEEQFGLVPTNDDMPSKEVKKQEWLFVKYMYKGVQDKMLKKHKIYIDIDLDAPVSTYRIIPSSEQARYASKKAAKKASVAINAGMNGITYIDESTLTEAELKDTNSQRERFGRLAKTFRTARKEFKNMGITAATAKSSARTVKDVEA